MQTASVDVRIMRIVYSFDFCNLHTIFSLSFHIFLSQKGLDGTDDSSAGETAIALVADCILRGQNIKYNWLAKSGWMCGRPDFMCETRETGQKLLAKCFWWLV